MRHYCSKNGMLIINEHAILAAIESHEEVPASGWLRAGGFEYVDGIGLCSNNWKWTAKAQGYIEAEEYKYLSPFFLYDTSGNVLGLINLALTNTPNLDSLPPARLAAAAQEFFAQNLTQDSEMDELLEQLRWMLNLPLSATAEEILAELGKLQQQIKEKTGVALAANSQNLFDAIAAIEQLKLAANSQATPDPSKYVPIAMYNEAKAQAASVATNGQEKEIKELITAACSDGRLTGNAAVAWANDFAIRDFAGLKAHLEGIPKIAALSQRQTSTVNLAGGGQQQQPSQPDDIAVSIDAQLGI